MGYKEKKNCNVAPWLNGSFEFNFDTSKIIVNYNASDENGDNVRVEGKITIGDRTIDLKEFGKQIQKLEYIDISGIKNTSVLKIELQAFDEPKTEESSDCYYISRSSDRFSKSLILKRDFLIIGYNTRESSFLIFLIFLLVIFIIPAFSLDSNRISFGRSIKLACLLFPICLGLIFSILLLNTLVEGESNHWTYILIFFVLAVSAISTYLVFKYIIPKIRI